LDIRAEDASEGTKQQIICVIEETLPYAAAFKPNSAYFEALGWRGMRMLSEVLKVIPADVPIVLDVKRGDIGETQGTPMNFPMIADPDRKVSDLYGMIHPNALNNLTVRSVFIIDPNKKLRLQITYPASTGRNFHEILRVIDSLQLTDNHSVATPVNWKDGDDCVVVPSISTEDARAKFAKGVTEIKPYLRMTPQPNK
jgi:hypothetical protein